MTRWHTPGDKCELEKAEIHYVFANRQKIEVPHYSCQLPFDCPYKTRICKKKIQDANKE